MSEAFEHALDRFWNCAYEWGWERKAHSDLRESAKAAEDDLRKEIASSQSQLRTALRDMVDCYQFYAIGYPEEHELKMVLKNARNIIDSQTET